LTTKDNDGNLSPIIELTRVSEVSKKTSGAKMQLKRWHFVAPSVLASVVAIAFFSGGPSVPMDNDTTSAAAVSQKESQPVAEDKEATLGTPIELAGSISLTVSELSEFKAKDPEALGVEGRPQLMDITIENKGSANFDLSSFIILETSLASDTSISCFDVFEADSGVSGVPLDPIVKPGATAKFKWAMVCPGPKGDDLTMTISLSDADQATFKTKIK
jgi:hypothetical protein